MPSDQLAWWEYRTYLLGFPVLQTCSHGHSVSTGTRGDRGTSEETKNHGDSRDPPRSPGGTDGETEDPEGRGLSHSHTAGYDGACPLRLLACPLRWPVSLGACHL